MRPIPAPDLFKDFIWRIKVDVRFALDLPLNTKTNNGLPCSFVEIGWSLYKDKEPNPTELNITEI